SQLAFKDQSCFVLTPLGAAALPHLHTNGVSHPVRGGVIRHNWEIHVPNHSPFWDAKQRVLVFAGQVVKRFRWRAINQEAVLSAFHEEGWPARIDDPLAPKATLDTKRRLHDTIKCLNHSRIAPLIHFRGDGSGEGVVWSPTEPTSARS